MSKLDGKEHEEFFAKFMKATIVTSVLIIILLAILWYFLIYWLTKISLFEKKNSISILAFSLLSDPWTEFSSTETP